MIPAFVLAHLRERYGAYEHRERAFARAAQELVEAERVGGERAAKVVAVRLDGDLALAVVAETDRVNVKPLEEATGARASIVPEAELAGRFRPCEPGAEPPFALFGIPIYVDDGLMRERTLVIPAGTHEDAAVVDASEWAWCERVRPLTNLGAPPVGRDPEPRDRRPRRLG